MSKTVVLIGKTGEGRTTLFNKITNSQQKTAAGGQNVTTNVFVKQSSYGDGFQLIDTPGFDSCSQTFNLIAGFLSAIDKFLINRIMVVIRYDRLELIKKELIKYTELFQSYKDKLTFVITFMDYIKNDYLKNVNEIQLMAKQQKINSVIFASRDHSGQQLCQLFDQEIQASVAQKISLTDDQQLSLLDRIDNDEIQYYLMQSENVEYPFIQYERQMRKSCQQNQNINYSQIKEYLKKIIKKCFLDCFRLMEQNEESEKYQIYLNLKNQIKPSLNNIIQLIEKSNKNDFEQFIEQELKSYEVGRNECLKQLEQAKKHMSSSIVQL
ncbi:unnamed protein product [Paramecium sonneborni]|uniref:G domain-containing protein n=1 Tax=Paramecium sonneborni TaxID=65129 RepID=A0A8S1KE89_9CILI|nr:unnamed protein product [Paramecium sonneborni]